MTVSNCERALIYESRVQRTPLTWAGGPVWSCGSYRRCLSSCEASLLAHSYISGEAQPSWNKHRLVGWWEVGGRRGVGGQAQRYDISGRRQFTTKHHNVQRTEKEMDRWCVWFYSRKRYKVRLPVTTNDMDVSESDMLAWGGAPE